MFLSHDLRRFGIIFTIPDLRGFSVRSVMHKYIFIFSSLFLCILQGLLLYFLLILCEYHEFKSSLCLSDHAFLLNLPRVLCL